VKIEFPRLIPAAAVAAEKHSGAASGKADIGMNLSYKKTKELLA